MTGRRFLLYDPAYKVMENKAAEILCEDVAGFVAAVGNLDDGVECKLVFLSPAGEFVYLNGSPAVATAIVKYKLAKSITAPMLCVDGERVFGQRTLVQYGKQWPEVLRPLVASPEGASQEDAESIAWQKIAVLNVVGSTELQASQGAGSGRLLVQKDDGVESAGLPEFWSVRSPWFDGGSEQDAVLRMSWRLPEMDTETGKIKGELSFAFALWTPAGAAIKTDAMDDACARMREALGDGYTVIRGTIG
jgi:hypothetical protein